MVVVVGLGSFAVDVITAARYMETSARILADVRQHLYEHLQRLSPRSCAAAQIEDRAARLNESFGTLQTTTAEAAHTWIGNLLFLAGTVVMLAWLDPSLFGIAVLVIPIGLIALLVYRRRRAAKVAAVAGQHAAAAVFLADTIRALRAIAAANGQEREAGTFRNLNRALLAAAVDAQRAVAFSRRVPAALLSLGTAAVLLEGGTRVIEGTLTLGTLAAFVTYQVRLIAPLEALMRQHPGIAAGRAAWRELTDLLLLPPAVEEPPDARPLTTHRGDVVLEDVTVSHRGAPVLDRVSVQVRSGERVAIVGPGGSGKSTVADLLVRLIDPDSGRILLDDVDVRSVALADLRRRVALVSQPTWVFRASVAENIRYGAPDAPEAAVREAARIAGLDPVVAAWPGGYDTVVEDGTARLSAPDRLRVALARALVRNPAVIVLDEPMAGLEADGIAAVGDLLDRCLRGRTAILLTSHAELAANASRVVILGAGRVAEPTRIFV